MAEPIYGYAPHPDEAPRTLIPAYLIAAGARIAVNASSGYDATVTGSRFHDNHLVVDYVTDSGITGTLRFPVVQTGVTLEV